MANSFANLVANLNLNIQNFSTNLRKASAQANQFAANLKGSINGGLVEPAKQSKFEFKDVARIVQGIMISKVFYSGLNSIRNCTTAVWEFSQELEYARMAYSNLFGDTALAEEFINVLEDFAATTPFSFSESEAAAKRLLAYGIEYKNVMYVMQGVLAASSMQNNPQVIESMSRALGQIYTKGRLMNEEMRQLAEAGIPAYEILAEKLGLTQEQLQNLGDQAIPASTAINALVDGMTERFGDVVDASTLTMQGIISNIKDNATMIASGIFEPMYTGIKSVLYEFGQFLSTLREIYATTGIGGLFENLIPEELHGALRQFAANIIILIQAVVRLVAAIGSALKPVLNALLRVFNAFAPVLTVVINALAALINIVTSNATAMKILTAALAAAATMWVVFKLKGLAAAAVSVAISAISKALAGLSAMLTFVVAHPFWALMIGLGGLLVGLSGGFGKLSNAISGVFKNLTKIGGANPDDLLLPSQEERANDIGKFNQALDDTSDSMDELADSTGKATKAAKGLLSFDEVFKLNQPDEGTGGGGIEIPEIEMPDLSGIGGGGLSADDLDFSGFADDYVTKLVEALKERIAGAGIGGIIGGALGGILGGELGAKVGAIAGAIAGWFWSDLAEALNLTDVGTVALPISTGLGAVIGAIAGGPMGAAIGAGIGALVGWLADSITRGIKENDWSVVGYPLGMGLGAGIGFLVGGPAGAAIGTAIGALVGWLSDLIVTGLNGEGWNFEGLGTSIGLGVGAAIGMVMGGPAGAVIGAAIGSLVGSLVGLIAKHWKSITNWFKKIFKSIGDWLTKTGKAYDEWREDVEDTINDWCDATYESIANWIADTWESFTEWVSDIGEAYDEWREEVEDTINTWCDNTYDAISDWVTDTWESFTEWVSDIGEAYDDWRKDVETTINTWCDNTYKSITGWVSDTWKSFTGWVSDTGKAYDNWRKSVETTVNTWCDNTYKSITGWTSNTWKSFTDWTSKVRTEFETWRKNVETTVSNWVSNTVSTISTWGSRCWSSISGWLKSIWDGFTKWLSDLWTKITKWIDDLWRDIWKDLTDIGTKVSRWWNNLWSGKSANVSVDATTGAAYGSSLGGHASGGVFNREHVARFAEGNKAEAIIPLENAGAMQPFVDAVSDGLTASLMPLVATIAGNQNQLQPLYVGTLIADERSLRELQRKMQIIQIQEDMRRGK